MKNIIKTFLIISILLYSTLPNVLANEQRDNENKENNFNQNCELVNLKNLFKYDLLVNNFFDKIIDRSNSDDDYDVYYQSPWLAFFLSYICPGGGQLYNGEIWKGIGFMAAFVIGMGIAYVGAWTMDENNGVLFDAGIIISAGTYLWQLIDAPISANRINRENYKKTTLLRTTLLKSNHFAIQFDSGIIKNKYSLGLDCKYEF